MNDNPYEKVKMTMTDEEMAENAEQMLIEPNMDETININNEDDFNALIAKKDAEMEDFRLRSMAEMENFKRRLSREHEENNKYLNEKILADLLPALDSLDLAIQYGEQGNSLLEGVIMTRKLFLDALKNHGLIVIGTIGEEFNHEIHEAVGQEQRDDMDEMHVSNLLQRGYYLRDRLLRPAKVMVSCK